MKRKRQPDVTISYASRVGSPKPTNVGHAAQTPALTLILYQLLRKCSGAEIVVETPKPNAANPYENGSQSIGDQIHDGHILLLQ